MTYSSLKVAEILLLKEVILESLIYCVYFFVCFLISIRSYFILGYSYSKL